MVLCNLNFGFPPSLLPFSFVAAFLVVVTGEQQGEKKSNTNIRWEEKKNQNISSYNETVQGKNCPKKSLAIMTCIEIYGKPGQEAEKTDYDCFKWQ